MKRNNYYAVILENGYLEDVCLSREEAEKIAEKACEFVKGNVYHRRDVGTTELVNKRVEHMKEILN